MSIVFNPNIRSLFQTFYTSKQVDLTESLAWLIEDEKSFGISEEQGTLIKELAQFYSDTLAVIRQIVDLTGVPIISKFAYIWLPGYYINANLRNGLSTDVITVTGRDFAGSTIPETTIATFAVPDTAEYLAYDGADNFWFDANGVLQQKTFTQLIESTTLRTFVKYSDFEPYEISAIGILKDDAVLTEDDKIELNRFFKLWCEYWGVLMDTGYMKDNRTLT